MRLHSSLLSQGPGVSLRIGTDPVVGSEEAALLIGVTGQAVRSGCAADRYKGARKDQTGAWHIPLSALPHLAQARYWAKNSAVAPGGWSEDDRRELPEEEIAELWRRFEGQTVKLKQKALRDREACLYWQLLKAQGLHHVEALAAMKTAFGMGKSTIYDKVAIIRGYPPELWPALLLAQWDGSNVKTVSWPEQAYQFFIRHALVPGAKVKQAWRRTEREAENQGWGVIPSYDTALADFRKLPQDVVTLAKDGETALKARSPTARRDYDMPLHQLWSLDGRRKDLMVIDRKGKLGPPDKVFRLWILAIEEVRSRYLVGYAIGAGLNADLVRGAFLSALKTTGRVVPRAMQMDNGMENAAKEISGGAAWRRRGKVKEDEIIGLLPQLGIEVSWAMPAHGQAKPVERLFGTLASMVETRPEFRGAYCGNSPEARPEEWDVAKAAPLELVEQALREEINAYHQTPHRGRGMGGRSPQQVYLDEVGKPETVFRRISEAEERMCALSAKAITIRRKDGGFTLHDAYCYSEETARLAPGKGYYVRYNPADLSDTLYVYQGEKLLCEAKKVELTGFNDKAAAKSILKLRRNYIKKVKEQAAALQELKAADTPAFMAGLRAEVMGEQVDPETGEILPAGKVVNTGKTLPLPKVLAMVNTVADAPGGPKSSEQLEREKEKAEVEELRKTQPESSVFDRALGRKRVGR